MFRTVPEWGLRVLWAAFFSKTRVRSQNLEAVWKMFCTVLEWGLRLLWAAFFLKRGPNTWILLVNRTWKRMFAQFSVASFI